MNNYICSMKRCTEIRKTKAPCASANKRNWRIIRLTRMEEDILGRKSILTIRSKYRVSNGNTAGGYGSISKEFLSFLLRRSNETKCQHWSWLRVPCAGAFLNEFSIFREKHAPERNESVAKSHGPSSLNPDPRIPGSFSSIPRVLSVFYLSAGETKVKP